MQRTLKDFINGIAVKCGLEPTKVLRTTHVNPNGLHIEVDEEVVRELPEGQDMLVELNHIKADSPPSKREWDISLDTVVDGDVDVARHIVQGEGFELKLHF
jgi:hypothetical protein